MNTQVSNTVDKTIGKVMKKWVTVLKTVNPNNKIARNEKLMSIAPFEMVWLSDDNRLIFQQYGQDTKSLDELTVDELRIAAALADNLAESMQIKDEPNAADKAQSLLDDYDSYAQYVGETELVSALRSVLNEVA